MRKTKNLTAQGYFTLPQVVQHSSDSDSKKRWARYPKILWLAAETTPREICFDTFACLGELRKGPAVVCAVRSRVRTHKQIELIVLG